MSPKKPTSKKPPTKKKTSQKSENLISFDSLPPRQSMERIMKELSGGGREMSALDEAQDIMFEAWEAPTLQQAVALAKKALSVSEDCADAYTMLAETTSNSVEEAIELYRKGVEAGERALGKEAFTDDVGHFWGLLETRPYMRARLGLAQCLFWVGKREEAVECYWEMLRLNPNDNQGVRDILISLLIELGRDEDAEKLHDQYKEEYVASWVYSRALLDFRKHGDSKIANKSMKTALGRNTFVPAYLLGRRKIPKELPEHYGIGDNNEAVIYAEMSKVAWRSTPGAVFWLKSRLGK